LGELPPPGQSTGLGRMLRATYNPLILRLRAIEKPIIAAVNGVAAGAGLSLALACDLRVASAEARFTSAFNRIGLVPDSGSTYLLPQVVGVGRALEMAWTGRAVDAEEALRIGLVQRVVAAERLMDEAQALAAQLAAGASKAMGLTKRAMYRALSLDLESVLDYEAGLQEAAARTADFREGVAAFREKRPPRFTGS
jgi:2-(1,2-epoxy-1,2-dihydrophenyl)acetyl-CoA isomerase